MNLLIHKICPQLSEVLQYWGHVYDNKKVWVQASHKDTSIKMISKPIYIKCGYINHPNHSVGKISQVSEIRLRRTDTTLDLSQKAEKVWRNILYYTLIKIDVYNCVHNLNIKCTENTHFIL